jgi:DNA-binding CsgD family transcriptional regulator
MSVMGNLRGQARSPLPRARLIERDAQLRVLEEAEQAAGTGDGRLVLVEGPAGIGKSAVLASVRDRRRRDGTAVLSARCSELESTYAFGVVRQLFETRLRATTPWLEGPARSAAAVFDAPVEPAPGGVADDVSHSVLHGLYWLTVNVCAEQSVALVVDDAQWCDRPSLRFLAYLAGRLDGLTLLVVVGARTGERSEQAALLAELAREERSEVVALQPLSLAGVTDLLTVGLGVAPRADFAQACLRATGGNPLLLDELSRAMQADGISPDVAPVDVVADLGPRAVSRTVLLRLARLDAGAVALAQAVAVLGEAADLAVLRGMTGLPDAGVEQAARALVHAQILRPQSPMGFVHPLLRDAVYQDLSPLELEARHGEAARLLHAAGRSAEEIAAHALLLPPGARSWIVDVLSESAATALSRGAPDVAVSYLRRALAEPPTVDREPALVTRLGLAEALANEPQEATVHLAAAYEVSTDPEARARIAEVLARMLLFTRPPDEAVAVAQRARMQLPPHLVDCRDALTALELYAVAFGATDDGRALAASTAVSGSDGLGARMLAAVRAWDLALTGGSAARCVEEARYALRDGVLLRHDPSFMTHIAAGVLALADDAGAVEVWSQALAEGHTHGSQMTISGVLLWQGWGLLQRGDLEDAEESLRRYRVATQRRGGDHEAGAAYGIGFLVRVLVARGKLAEARRLAGLTREWPAGSDGDLQQVRGIVEVLLADGRWGEALAVLDGIPRRHRPVVNPVWAPWGSLAARALGGLGRREEALARAADEVAAARVWAAPTGLGAALRALGVALDLAGSPEALPALEEATAVTDGSPARLEHAASLLAHGGLLRRGRQPTLARPLLEQAAGLARACGATPLADRATQEFRAAGGQRLSRHATGVDALTPSERRVAALAASGRSNKAIAQELFVTTKTVEIHLSNTYRKLGVGSRGDLAGLIVVEG